MFPSAFLQSYWRLEVRPEVFVAIGKDRNTDERFESVIKPAIEETAFGGQALKANRVDISRSDESVLADIVDGIAHSCLVVADVSRIYLGRSFPQPMRNADVFYEVGVALACRRPEEVLLIRDDDDQIMLDTSMLPQLKVDFGDARRAREILCSALRDRINDRDLKRDARIRIAIAGLSSEEFGLLRELSELKEGESIDLRTEIEGQSLLSVSDRSALMDLLNGGLVVADSLTDDDALTYRLSVFGQEVVNYVESLKERRTKETLVG